VTQRNWRTGCGTFIIDRPDTYRPCLNKLEMDTNGTVMREGQTYSGESLLSRYASLVKLPHTLFALPFAGVGALLASYTYSNVTWLSVVWIVLAFTAARFAAMGFNRIVDRVHDARNPRTAAREIPVGKLTVNQAAVAVTIAAAVFVFSSFQLNALCGWLSFIALAWVFFYSYTKRFTSFSHYVLGLSLAIAPVGAYLAIAGQWAAPWYSLLVLALAVMTWVSGFDVVYAIQDIDFDRKAGLHSMPARLGVKRALLLSRIMHMLAVAAFTAILAFELFPVGVLYAVGVGFMGGLLMYEHRIVRGGQLNLKKIDRAFFQLNVLVSTSFFVFTLLDRLFTR
jgi:4-hydroxybenzoate polyprenyltransferase